MRQPTRRSPLLVAVICEHERMVLDSTGQAREGIQSSRHWQSKVQVPARAISTRLLLKLSSMLIRGIN